MKLKAIQWGHFPQAFLLVYAFAAFGQPVARIAAGNFHSLFIKTDGSLWGMGENPFGQLGDGNFIVVSPYGTNFPMRSLVTNVSKVAAGSHHSFCIKSDGSLWAMGLNTRGQLGDGTATGLPAVIGVGMSVPECIVSNGVAQVAAGDDHSLFVKDDGSLWSMGANQYGQLGDGTTNDSLLPEMIVPDGVTVVAAGSRHTLFLKTDGSAWAMGNDTFGQLGDGGHGTGLYTNTPQLIVTSNVAAIAAGNDHSLLLLRDGSLWGMGNNSYQQLGDGVPYDTTIPRLIVSNGVAAIAAGWECSYFLMDDGSLWGMGYNGSGQLGDGTLTQVNHPKQLVAGGVVAIAARQAHVLFLKQDGSLWGAGGNTHGELGDGTLTNASRDEQILGAYNRVAIQPIGGGRIRLSFVGVADAAYALDCSTALAPPAWTSQETNCANWFGAMLLTNSMSEASNNFWRTRIIQ